MVNYCQVVQKFIVFLLDNKEYWEKNAEEIFKKTHVIIDRVSANFGKEKRTDDIIR